MRIEKRAQQYGIEINNDKQYEDWLVENGPKLRGTTPAEVEKALLSEQREDVMVVVNECGMVITSYRRSEKRSEAKERRIKFGKLVYNKLKINFANKLNSSERKKKQQQQRKPKSDESTTQSTTT